MENRDELHHESEALPDAVTQADTQSGKGPSI